MITFRGETDVDKGFRAYLAEAGVAVRYTVRDLGQDVGRMAALRREIRALAPDLIYVWGTPATLALVGPFDAPADSATPPYIHDIPVVFALVGTEEQARTAVERWVYTDVGKFSGLIETMDEAIKFPIWTEKKGEMEEVVIAGPTCDSADIMYENYKYGLPLNLAIGDRLYWLSTGAYTTSYSAVEFNGFPPLKAYYI